MANKVSTLAVRLKDEVSGPARKASRSIRDLDRAAKNAKGGVGPSTSAMGAGVGRAALAFGGAAAGAYAFGRAISSTVTKTADLDRRMTRLRLTAGASASEMDQATIALQKLAVETAHPLDNVTSGLEALVAGGRSLGDSMGMIGAIARTAQASGSEVEDIAKTADSVSMNFKIAGKDMQSAFDIMVAGGKAGRFELKDMARYLPSLAPAAAAIGLKGTEGLEQMIAMLQIVRKGTGTTEEAATSMSNIFQKMESEETAKKFGKFGINLRKEMKDARKNGRNLLEVFEELTAKALSGDLSKLPQLFTDAQFATGMRALLTFRGEWQKLQAEMHQNAPGAVMKDFGAVTQGVRAELDRISESWDALQIRIGKKMEPAVLGVLQSIREQMDGTAIPQAQEMPVVRPGMNPASGPDTDRRNRPAPGSGGNRSRQGNGAPFDPAAETTRRFMNLWAEGQRAQRARKSGGAVSSGEQYVTQVSVPTMIEDIRARAKAAGGITAGESIRQQMTAETRIEKLIGNYVASQQNNKSLGLPPSRLEQGTLRANLEDQVRTILNNELAREGKGPANNEAVASRVDGLFRLIEGHLNGLSQKVDTSQVSAVQGAATEAGQAIQGLGSPVAVNIDGSAIRAVLADVRALNAELAKVGPGMQAASVNVESSFGRRFNSRRDGSFADWEHS
ncbi:phage tail tape measure protein [Microvirga sp. CF3016]|uniref:phage tail tape measure protein n=1 Tax=Microvirga sp. CF3016 TaxID=3110181 RepID=UPI002E782FE9|nr:phage tail tape measure protein [Microvirga sp. CF3016]MEE1612070.1 phage tail tape measure protein [Microvirga sp. CF3016]